MGKLHGLKQAEVIKILVSNGFVQIRSNKHITFKRTDAYGNILTTWVPHHKEVSVFVIQYIIKQTGKPREEFY